ncbi:Uma2 family endonuclease [Arsenicibacter rosenii]|nr:Uma2 family endonuclease [Arsenicibacter rosenii]
MQEVQVLLNEERAKRVAFYNAIDESMKVEFINGEIIMHSPVKKAHNEATKFLSELLDLYARKHKLGFVGIEKIMTALTRNDYEPDICFFKKEKADSFVPAQTLFPAPDLVVEVLSEGTAKRDRGIKFYDYEAHGIEEYWIIDPDAQTIEQYHLVNNAYELILKASEGTIKSFALTGFQIPIRAVFDDGANMDMIATMARG